MSESRNRYWGYYQVGLSDTPMYRHIVITRMVSILVLHEIALLEDIAHDIGETDQSLIAPKVWSIVNYDVPGASKIREGETVSYEIFSTPTKEGLYGQTLYPLIATLRPTPNIIVGNYLHVARMEEE